MARKIHNAPKTPKEPKPYRRRQNTMRGANNSTRIYDLNAIGELLSRRFIDLKITDKAFAERAGIPYDQLMGVMHGSKICELSVMERLLRASGLKTPGEITDFLWRAVLGKELPREKTAAPSIFMPPAEFAAGDVWYFVDMIPELLKPEVFESTKSALAANKMRRYMVPTDKKTQIAALMGKLAASGVKNVATNVRCYTTMSWFCKFRVVALQLEHTTVFSGPNPAAWIAGEDLSIRPLSSTDTPLALDIIRDILFRLEKVPPESETVEGITRIV